MRKRKRLKRRYRKILYRIRALFFLVLFVFLIYYFIKLLFFKNYIDSYEFEESTFVVYLKDDTISCILSKEKPDITDRNWVRSEDYKCMLNINENNTYLYLKKDDKIVYTSNNDLYIKLNESKTVYLSNKDSYDYFKYVIGNINKLDADTSNNNIKYKDGVVTANKYGESDIEFKYNDYSFKSHVVVTNLISNRDNYQNKENLSCNKYSNEESKLLDKILESKIENAGYKTRAGVVEAARFLTLDFSYKINYFYENGRQTTNKVDGEGRYYHKGLYLSEDKYSSLTGSTYTTNKGTWGCKIYSYPIEKKDYNGLDCSGFVSWALLNGGFDVKDVGAGWSDSLDLTDYGDVKKLNKEVSTSNEIRVGDLLHSERLGGHIAIIIGIDNENYYVAQAIWYDEVGVVVTKIKKENLSKEFGHVVLMDKYYQKDGNLTNMW